MICSAAVRVLDKKQNKEVILPCHRHYHVMKILYELGYAKEEFRVLEQGFLNEKGEFVNRKDALHDAISNGKVPPALAFSQDELFSEDLW